MPKVMTKEEALEFKPVYDKAAKIGVEAIEFLDNNRTFMRKGEVCYRTAATMEKLLFKKYPAQQMLSEEEVKNLIDSFSEAAKKKATAPKKQKKATETEDENK